MAFFSYLNQDSDITHILFRNPERYKGINDFTHQLLRQKSELTIGERELLAAYVSSLNACQYCIGIHERLATQFRFDEKILAQLHQDINTSPVSPKLKPIFEFAKKLTLTPSQLQPHDAQLILQQGWSEQTLEDVIGIISLFNYYNRLLEGHGIKGNTTIFDSGANLLAKRGYKIPTFIAKFLNWKRSKQV